ncbi:MAG: copper chaperone PCu(A)C [Pseudomonadota bacterium]
MSRLLLSVSLLGFAAACAPAPSTSDASPVLSYTDAFVTEPVGDRDVTSGGVTLSVAGGDVALTGASSPSFDAIELHTMSMSDGQMQMRMVEKFDIADGERLELKRGGNHLMMFGIKDGVVSGETVDITLNFEASGQAMNLIVEADVRALGE